MIDNLKSTFENFNKNITTKNTISKIRQDNFDKFLSSGFPNKKLEDWKFSDFKKIISQNFKNLKINLKNKKKLSFDNHIKEFSHNKIFFLNGFYNKHSFKYEDDKKIIFSNLKNGPAYEPKGNNSLNLLNNALATGGYYLEISKNYKFKKPLVVYNLFSENIKEQIISNKNSLILKEN